MVDVSRHLVDEQILRRAVTRVDGELKTEPALAAELYKTIGQAYFELGLYLPAADIAARSANASEQAHGADDPTTINAKLAFGDALRRAGRYKDAESTYGEALATFSSCARRAGAANPSRHELPGRYLSLRGSLQ
jgi:tetratricopeptide (TPR) repeat protein